MNDFEKDFNGDNVLKVSLSVVTIIVVAALVAIHF